MASILSLSLVLALSQSLAQASLIKLPRATPITRDLDPKGWTPRPTADPLLPPELLKRAYLTNAAQYVLLSPDKTCGYISGSAGADFACPTSTQTCVFFPVTATSTFGAVGCCTDVENCYIRTKCVDAKAYSSQSACDDACRFDANTLKCTASASPYCGSIRYPQASAQDYYCDSVSRSTWLLASTTFNGETDRTLTSSNIRDSTSSSRTSSRTSTTATSGTTTTSSSATTSPTITPAPAAAKAVMVGPIVGGVIGGLAIIAIFALAALYILKKYGKKPKSSQPSEIGLNDHEQGPPPGPVEIGEAWRAAEPVEYYKPQAQYGANTQYQPIVAEMAGSEYVYVEKSGAQELGSTPSQLGSPVPKRKSVGGISVASNGNRNSMAQPDYTVSPDLRHVQQ